MSIRNRLILAVVWLISLVAVGTAQAPFWVLPEPKVLLRRASNPMHQRRGTERTRRRYFTHQHVTEFRQSGSESPSAGWHFSRTQQRPATEVTTKVLSTIRRLVDRGYATQSGFDGLAVTMIEGVNDNTPFGIAPIPPSLAPNDSLNYERLILRIAGLYVTRFSTI